MSCQDKQSDPSYPVRLYNERGRGTPSKFAYLNLWVGGRVCACACVCTLVPGSPGTTKNSRIIGGPSTKVVYVIMSNTHGNHVVITKRLIQCDPNSQRETMPGIRGQPWCSDRPVPSGTGFPTPKSIWESVSRSDT